MHVVEHRIEILPGQRLVILATAHDASPEDADKLKDELQKAFPEAVSISVVNFQAEVTLAVLPDLPVEPVDRF